MRSSLTHTYLMSLYFLMTSATPPRENSERLPEGLSPEPTCDELRAMWRFSKRQSRASERSNNLPTYKDPFAHNVWQEGSHYRSVGGGKLRRPLVYGRLVHSAMRRPRVHETMAEETARMFGGEIHSRSKLVAHQDQLSGSFQHLKELIQGERARELHEQKMAEQNAARMSALRYRQGLNQDRDFNYRTRTRSQLGGVNLLAPSRYPQDPLDFNYLQRSNSDWLVSVFPLNNWFNLVEDQVLSIYCTIDLHEFIFKHLNPRQKCINFLY